MFHKHGLKKLFEASALNPDSREAIIEGQKNPHQKCHFVKQTKEFARLL